MSVTKGKNYKKLNGTWNDCVKTVSDVCVRDPFEGNGRITVTDGTGRLAVSCAAPARRALRDAALAVRSGELVAVCGPVAAGKSTLLAAAWGEALVLDGSVRAARKLALVPQRPFIIGRGEQGSKIQCIVDFCCKSC